MPTIAQALSDWWTAQAVTADSLAAILATHSDELARNPKAVEIALLAIEICAGDAERKAPLKATLAELAAAQGVFCPGATPAQVEAVLAAGRRAPPRVKVREQLAPKFYTGNETRQSDRRFEMAKLRRRKRRLEKRLGAELGEAARAEQRVARARADKARESAQRRENRLQNELQQQKKLVEKENTSGVLGDADRRRKRVKRRK